MQREKTSTRALNYCILALSIFICLFHLFITLTTSVSVMQQRVIHVFCLMLLWYMYAVGKPNASKKRVAFSAIMLAVVAVVFVYYLLETRRAPLMEKGIWGITPVDAVMGILLILLVLEVSRETIGIALPIIGVVFLLYALVGPYLPEIIAHRGYDLTYISSYLSWTNEGIFGTPIGASVSFVVLYIIFGELLDVFGAGKFFIDLSYALTGRMRGGPAEASVLSSALLGSINGSAVANVVTTGTFTIPLMKKVGYRPEYAGAVEAVASTGGQILPPVMGAAAFVMADLTGIPYSTIIIAALVPGLFYYITLGAAVYFEAGRIGIKPEDSSKLQKARVVLKQGWFHLIPLIVLLVCLLGFGFSANYSAIFAILAVAVIGIINVIRKEHRFPVAELKKAALHAAKSSVSVAIACASAGIVIGIVSMTGLGVRFAQIVFDLAGGRLLPMLLMTMVACIILGMGLPSTAAYIIAATVAAPALIQAGVSDLAANLFVFYFAIISFITPPVAIASYAAAGLAESDTMKTGLQAFLLGITGFINPYLFIYRKGVLIYGSDTLTSLIDIAISLVALILMAMGFEGWCRVHISKAHRALLIVSSLLLILPGVLTTTLGFVGAAVGIIWLIIGITRGKKTPVLA